MASSTVDTALANSMAAAPRIFIQDGVTTGTHSPESWAKAAALYAKCAAGAELARNPAGAIQTLCLHPVRRSQIYGRR